MEKPNLLKNEEIMYEAKPLQELRGFYIFGGFLGLALMFGFFTIPLSIGLIVDGEFAGGFVALMVFGLSLLLSLGLSYWIGDNSYKQRYYWVTNKRVIFRRGTFGYKISSLPYERISDVIISRTFWETTFGFGSVKIQTMAGQISQNSGGSEGYLQAVPEPEKVQELILDLLEKKNSKNV